MSNISHNPAIDRAGLGRSDQLALDDLQQRGRGPDVAADEARIADARMAPVAAVDPGEDALNLVAWDNLPVGQRLLAGDVGFERQLGALDLSLAADHGAQAVFDALA